MPTGPVVLYAISLVKPGVPDASTEYSAVRVLYGSYQSDSREALFHLVLPGLLLRFARRKPALEPFLRLPKTWTKGISPACTAGPWVVFQGRRHSAD